MAEETKSGEKFKNIHRSLGKMLYYNFLGGIAWGLGVLIGTSIIFALIAFFISKIDFVPILGQILADVIKASQTNQMPVTR